MEDKTQPHPLSDYIDSDTELEMVLQTLETSDSSSPPLEQMSPSSSTSSNISSKNRYLYPITDTVEHLRPEEVRWFYKIDTDKKAKWLPMIGYDSLRVECQFREYSERLKISEEPEAINVDRISVRGGLYEADVKERKCFPIYWHRTDESISIMRGSWFCDSNFQPLDEHVAERLDQEHVQTFASQPLKDVYSEGRGPYTVLHTLKFQDFYVEWHATSSISLYYDSTSSKIYRAVGARLGLSQMGTRLRRGYVYEALIDDKPPDITHLVFVVHGIGQKMNQGNIIKRCADLRDTCERMKDIHWDELSMKKNKRVEFLPVEWRSSLRLDGDIVDSITPTKMFKLRSLLNSSAMDIMYYTSPLYRSEITQGLQSRLDQLYRNFCERHPYFEHGGGKVSIVAHSLGAVIIYDIVTGWDPMWLYDQYASKCIKPGMHAQSKISMCLRNADVSAGLQHVADDLISELENNRAKVRELEKRLFAMAEQQQSEMRSNLPFMLENLFCLGSPLSVFLAMRGMRPSSDGSMASFISPTGCKRLFNIFHPRDPVAYRLEPLVLRHYETLMPLMIYNHDQPKKVPYQTLPTMAYTDHHFKRVKRGAGKSSPRSESPKKEGLTQESRDKPSNSSWGNFFRRSAAKQSTSPVMEEMREVRFSPSSSDKSDILSDDEGGIFEVDIKSVIELEGKPDLEFRLDYQLKEGSMANAYWSTLTSHTAYWTSPDVAFFILQQIFPDVPI